LLHRDLCDDDELTPSALASQSLSVIVALIPYIREFIRRHLSVKQAVMLTEFDKLKRVRQLDRSFVLKMTKLIKIGLSGTSE
jgi:hypothetical protein